MLVETTAIALAQYVYSNCIVDFFVSFFASVVMLFTVKKLYRLPVQRLGYLA